MRTNICRQSVLKEHDLDANGRYEGVLDTQHEGLNVYFNETSPQKFDARAVLIDLDPKIKNELDSDLSRAIFRPENFVLGELGAGSNWAKGYLTDGEKLAEHALDVIRREAESCDCLQGFQITHSIGSGTGGGMGALLLDKLREEFPDRMMATFSVLPSEKVSDSLVEPYNATLSIHHLAENADLTFCLDNEAVFDICQQTLKLPDPSYRDFNDVISATMSGITSYFRFPGQIKSDLRKMAADLVPFPRLHFFTVGSVPLTEPGVSSDQALNSRELTLRLFDQKSILLSSNIRNGRFLSCDAIFRGTLSIKEVEHHIAKLQAPSAGYFAEPIPKGIQTSHCSVAPHGFKVSSTVVANTTSCQDPFKRIEEKFTWMFRRKAYMRPYDWEGMDEMEFTEAQSNIIDLISEYQQYPDFQIDDGWAAK